MNTGMIGLDEEEECLPAKKAKSGAALMWKAKEFPRTVSGTSRASHQAAHIPLVLSHSAAGKRNVSPNSGSSSLIEQGQIVQKGSQIQFGRFIY
jgi:hypothetical protein